MARVVSLYFPTLPTDRLNRALGAKAPPSDQPLVLVQRRANKRQITALNDAAYALGLRSSMAASKAQAMIGGLHVFDANPDADRAALERTALWTLQRFSPLVAADPPDGLVMDIAGAAHLQGGEEALLATLLSQIEAAGLKAKAALADTWGAAHALARFHPHRAVLVEPGESRKVLLALPVAALRLDADTVETLRILGLETIGELAAQPRAPLALRFGPQLGRRIDQAFGIAGEPIEPIRSPQIIEVERVFGEPIAAPETIARAIGTLAQELTEALVRKGLGVRRLDMLCERVDSRAQAVRIGTALPMRDAKRLTRMLTEKIETIDPGFGIEKMRLSAVLAEPLDVLQSGALLMAGQDADISALIDVLANRMGEDALYRFAPVPSDVPERSVRRVAPLAKDDGASWPTQWPRPARLLARPEPIDTMALLPDQPPVWFIWRGVRRRVRAADGPERIFGEWWKRAAETSAVRDYFQVEDETGERFWIYRSGDGENPNTGSHRWFLHGIFA